MQESHRTELKVQLTDGLEKEVIAFLNSREGGEIYIGYTDEGNPRGVDDADSDMLKIKDRLKNKISPSVMGLFDVQRINESGHDIIKIGLSSGAEKPYFLTKQGMSPKGCFIRTGTAAEPMEQRMIDELFSKRTRNSLSKIRSNKQDLTFEQLKIYYQETGRNLNDHFAKTLELLTEDGSYNYVAYLLSDNNSNSIKFATYSGIGREKLVETIELGFCSIVKTAKDLLSLLELRNPKKTSITGKERIDVRAWDPISLREAVINALVHNDYTKEIMPKVELFSNRIEITSAGGLPEGLNEHEYFEGFSVPRNKELIRVFRDLGLVEQLGSGIPRILEHYGREYFNFSENFLRIVFPDFISQVSEEVDKISQQRENAGLVDGLVERLVDGLVESQRKIVHLVVENPEITIKEMADTIGISTTAIDKNITKLKEKNIIRRVGGERGGRWEIINI